MDRVDRAFLSLLHAALRGSAPQAELTDDEWQALFRLAAQQKLLPLVYEAAFRLPDAAGRPVFAERKMPVMQQVMMQARRSSEFLALSRDLAGLGVRALVVKGIVCRALYARPDHRPSGDEDVLVAPEDFDACHAILLRFGLAPDAGQDMDAYEVSYRKPGTGLHIELHRHLFPPDSEAYGEMDRFFDGVFDRAVTVPVPGGEVRTLAPTDHMLYLVCHAFKHFLHSGFGLRQVCDIVLFAEHYGGQISWAQVLCRCREIRADGFLRALLAIGKNHLGFDASAAGCPAELYENGPDEMPMLEDLLRAGVYGGADMSRKHSSTITLHAVAGQKRGKSGRGGTVRTLFPPLRDMQGRYPYLRRFPVLLPAAWVGRIVTYGREVARSEHNDPISAVRIGAERVSLLTLYGIVEK